MHTDTLIMKLHTLDLFQNNIIGGSYSNTAKIILGHGSVTIETE